MTNEKPKKHRRDKQRPLSEFPPELTGSFMDEPDGWEYLTGNGVAIRELDNDRERPIPVFSGVLGLGGWVADRYEFHEDGHFVIHARCKVVPVTCTCGSSNLIRFGSQTQKFRDLPVQMRPTTLMVERQRLRCKDCGKTQFQYLPHMHLHLMMTDRLVEYIQRESLKRTFTGIAEDVGTDEKTVRQIFAAYAKELDVQHKVYTPEWLGIDEVHLTRQMRCVLTDVYNRRPLDLLKDRNKPTVMAWLRKHIDPAVLKVVTMDMHTGYLYAVQEVLPDAKIVVDKFHVTKPANTALEYVRKMTHKELTDAQRKQLKHDRKIMLLRRDDLSPQQSLILQTWLGNFEDLGKAYMLKEAFYDIYSFPTRIAAENAFSVWLDDLNSQSDLIREAFSSLVTFMFNWREYIFNYFDFRATNAYTESFNGYLKQIYRNGRGYSFPAIRAKVLYGKLDHQR